jgi:hypothetical protein
MRDGAWDYCARGRGDASCREVVYKAVFWGEGGRVLCLLMITGNSHEALVSIVINVMYLVTL